MPAVIFGKRWGNVIKCILLTYHINGKIFKTKKVLAEPKTREITRRNINLCTCKVVATLFSEAMGYVGVPHKWVDHLMGE